MGGDADAASKCILGIASSSPATTAAAADSTDEDYYLLIADPHCWQSKRRLPDLSVGQLLEQGWLSWKNAATDFVDSSMYNICLPQLK